MEGTPTGRRKSGPRRLRRVASASLLAVFLVLTVAGCGAADPAPTRTPTDGSPLASPAADARYPVMEVVVVDGAVTHREIPDLEAFLAASDTPVFLDFWADWCPPCKASAPFVETLAAEYAGRARIVKVDVDAAPSLAGSFGVSAIPQFNVVKGGKVVGKQAGYAASIEPALRDMIDGAIA